MQLEHCSERARQSQSHLQAPGDCIAWRVKGDREAIPLSGQLVASMVV